MAAFNKIELVVDRLTGAEKLSLMDCCKAMPLGVEETGTPFIVVACKEKFSGTGGFGGGVPSFLEQPQAMISKINNGILCMVKGEEAASRQPL